METSPEVIAGLIQKVLEELAATDGRKAEGGRWSLSYGERRR